MNPTKQAGNQPTPSPRQRNLLVLPNSTFSIAGTTQYIVPPFGFRSAQQHLTEESFQV